MAVHRLLLRGMLVGLLAGFFAFGFAKVFGEPSVDRAIAFEASEASSHHADDHSTAAHDDVELFNRGTQAGLGLLAGMLIYGSALGGLFALAFAVSYGRFSGLAPKPFAALLALLCFVAVFAVPYLKYPANPPSVGDPDTIGRRTALYFSMIAISLVAMMAAFSLRRLAAARLGSWNATLVGTLTFLVLAGSAALILPSIDEVPSAFSAGTLWHFRLASLGIQSTLWMVIGLLFGALTERALSSPKGA